MDGLTALAAAAFGSTAYLITFSTVKWLNALAPRVKVTALAVTGMILCGLIGIIASASQSVAIGFVVGAGLTPPAHRWMLRRRLSGRGGEPLSP
ncbi:MULTISPECIES: hypothetical protein [unclassified Streptomyces]|uniref:hypothetical protein n=1 Tax=unclassified Streptomyces TaxID=2593676 RepID=UPI00068ACCA9|nr:MULTISPECIES: hypothetical protein [unclassified Streptomyces]